MKWLKIIVVSLLIGAVVPLAITPASPAMAATNADVLITVTPGYGLPGTITGFTLTDLGSITVTANWTADTGNVTHTMIRSSRTSYPTTTSDGELMYYGENTSCNWTGFSLETTEYFFSAWSYNATSGLYSVNYATASIGGEGMESVSESIDGLTVYFQAFAGSIGDILLALLLISITFISFYKRDMILYIVSGLIAFSVGALWFDDYLLIAIAVIGLGLYQLITAVIEAITSGGPSRGFSQFRGIYNAIKGAFRR